MRHFPRHALVIALVGGAFAVLLHGFPRLGLPVWPQPSALHLLPAIVCAVPTLTERRFKERAMPFTIVGFMAIALLWTVPAERVRGAFIVLVAVSVLAVAALIVRYGFLERSMRIFIYASAAMIAASLAFSALNQGVVIAFQRVGDTAAPSYGFVTNRNQVAIQIALAAVFALLLSRTDRRMYRWFWALSVLTVLTGSRAQAFALFVGCAVVFLQGSQWPKRKAVAAALLPAVLVGGVLMASQENSLIERFFTEASLTNQRDGIWANASERVWNTERYAVVGVGTGGVQKLLGRDDPLAHVEDGVARRSSHSAYVEWLASYGALGVLLGGVFLMWLVPRVRHVDRQLGAPFMAAPLATVGVSGFALPVYQMPFFAVAGGVILAMLWTCANPDKVPAHPDERRGQVIGL